MSIDPEQSDGGDEPRFRTPFSDVDRDLLEARAPHLVEFLDLAAGVREASAGHRSLGGQEALAALRALEVARRLVEAMSTDMLAHYQRIGDCSAHGYRTTAGLLAGEFRVSPGEARRRTTLSERLAGRVSVIGEAQEPVRPAVAEQFADGRISADEAKALCDAVDDLPPTIRALHADGVEKTLVELAPTVSLKDLPKLSQRIIQNIDPDGTLPRFETDPLKYHLTLTQQRNGDWRMKGLLDCPTGTTLRALLYGRMKDADVPVAVRPHAACNADGEPAEAVPAEAVPVDRGRADGGPAEGTRPDPDDLPAAGGLQVPDDADDYSVTSAVETERAAVPGEADDGRSHTDSGPQGPRTPPVPQIPLEAMWEVTRVTVRADATIDVDGRLLSFLEDEPHICLDETGWPVYLRPRVTEEVQRLLREARASESGAASGVVREKILGRAPTQPDGSDQPPPIDRPPPCDRPPPTDQLPPPHDRPSTSGQLPPSDQLPSLDRPLLAPLVTDGVLDDGSRSGLRISGSGPPGLARHDRFAFLLRCVARERVLHGADHALVVTASADDLVRPGALLSTHAGAPTTLGGLEGWSNAAQMFVHVTDGGGRSLDVRSQGRFATRTQMAVLAARDQGCTFPDCDAPAEWCEAHHILAYAQGGKTEIDNLTLVCPFHHRWFERTGWDSEFHRGLPAWRPPKAIDPRQRLVFHSRFRVALLGLPPELPFDA